MAFAILIARVLLGLPLTAFGLMGFVKVMPDPHAFWETQEGFAPEAAGLILAMWDSGFIMPAVCAAHLVAGVLVLANRYVALALIIHLPVSVHMTLFHLFLDPATGAVAYVVLVLNVLLMAEHRAAYRPLLTAKPTPSP